MAIKETPINVRQIYKSFRDSNVKKLKQLKITRESLINDIKTRRNEIINNVSLYKDKYNINLNDYEEFVKGEYIDGSFYKVSKGIFLNRKEDYKLVSDAFDLFKYAEKIKELHDLDDKINFTTKLSKIELLDYLTYMRHYFTIVHKKMILEGLGYVFGEGIGWVCINRFEYKPKSPALDYMATRKREAELKAAGKKIYNKEEAEWCKKHGIEYKAEDKRVYRDVEYEYEIPLIGSMLPGGYDLKLQVTDYRHSSLRGLNNGQLVDMCNGDVNKICELQVDVKCKLRLCLLANKLLYYKYIRNENQKSYKIK